jgi:hypothetical protein
MVDLLALSAALIQLLVIVAEAVGKLLERRKSGTDSSNMRVDSNSAEPISALPSARDKS